MTTGTASSDFYLSVDGYVLPNPAVDVENMHDLLTGPAVRGSNRVLPYAAGRRPYRRRIDETVVSLELTVFADVDPDGLEHPSNFDGLRLNLGWLREHITDPTAAATRTATLHFPDGTTQTAEVQFGQLETGAWSPVAMAAAVDMVLPQGVFA
jgi:hypothetical protein